MATPGSVKVKSPREKDVERRKGQAAAVAGGQVGKQSVSTRVTQAAQRMNLDPKLPAVQAEGRAPVQSLTGPLTTAGMGGSMQRPTGPIATPQVLPNNAFSAGELTRQAGVMAGQMESNQARAALAEVQGRTAALRGEAASLLGRGNAGLYNAGSVANSAVSTGPRLPGTNYSEAERQHFHHAQQGLEGPNRSFRSITQGGMPDPDVPPLRDLPDVTGEEAMRRNFARTTDPITGRVDVEQQLPMIGRAAAERILGAPVQGNTAMIDGQEYRLPEQQSVRTNTFGVPGNAERLADNTLYQQYKDRRRTRSEEALAMRRDMSMAAAQQRRDQAAQDGINTYNPFRTPGAQMAQYGYSGAGGQWPSQDALLARALQINPELAVSLYGQNQRAALAQQGLGLQAGEINQRGQLAREQMGLTERLQGNEIAAGDQRLDKTIGAQQTMQDKSLTAEDQRLDKTIGAQERAQKTDITARDLLADKTIRAQERSQERGITADDQRLDKTIGAQKEAQMTGITASKEEAALNRTHDVTMADKQRDNQIKILDKQDEYATNNFERTSKFQAGENEKDRTARLAEGRANRKLQRDEMEKRFDPNLVGEIARAEQGLPALDSPEVKLQQFDDTETMIKTAADGDSTLSDTMNVVINAPEGAALIQKNNWTPGQMNKMEQQTWGRFLDANGKITASGIQQMGPDESVAYRGWLVRRWAAGDTTVGEKLKQYSNATADARKKERERGWRPEDSYPSMEDIGQGFSGIYDFLAQ